MEQLVSLLRLFISFVLLGLFCLSLHLYNVLISKPGKLRTKLLNQGIKGPKPATIIGNILQMKKMKASKKLDCSDGDSGHLLSHNYSTILYPHLEQWRNEYGPIFTYATGNMIHLIVADLEVVKAMTMCTSLNFGRPSFMQKYRKALFGQGILAANGETWAFQRKIIAPEFYIDKIKGMMNIMVESATSLLESWENKFDCEGKTKEIRIDQDLRNLSVEVISRTCFGSNYSEGNKIFSKLRALLHNQAVQGLALMVPGLRYVPTKNNRIQWQLEKEIGSLILQVVKEREESKSEQDLLAMILEGARTGKDLGIATTTDQFIIDNCKNIYLAGYETTAITATWVMVLLATNPEWQDRVREEVQQICRGCAPDIDMLHKMKMLTMVIQETLRLYPASPFVFREATQDMEFDNLIVPKGIITLIPTLAMHHDPNIWGPNAHKFEPDRFANGISGACSAPQAYMPFGCGSRICLGQNFAMVDLKILLSLIISKFSFSLSPTYRHSPVDDEMVIQPQYEVVLVVQRV